MTGSRSFSEFRIDLDVAERLYGIEVSPIDVARRLHLRDVPGLVFFDSGCSSAARFSTVMCEPTAVLTEREGRFVELPAGSVVDDPNDWMTRRFDARAEGGGEQPKNASHERVPFCGGLAGMLGFEFAWWIDRVRTEQADSPTPVLWVGDFPAALVYSHADACWWLTGDTSSHAAQTLRDATDSPASPRIGEAGRGDRFGLSVTSHDYCAGVQRAIDAIYAGEVFEVNYTERFTARWRGDSFSLYEQLRETSSGAYCAYLDAGCFQLASVSPEQFLAVDDRHVITRPIKGTRRRGETPREDARLAEELVTSAKDRAENVMIVDLMRNDLTRVCELGSVETTEICGLRSFAGVHHLVSTVEGVLEAGFSALDALLATFPAGSITGAPKLRAIELISTLEQTARGAYTGSLFYASCNGMLDSNVLIRTAVLCDETVWYGAGGAVVADSEPRGEYEEACLKARPLQLVTADE